MNNIGTAGPSSMTATPSRSAAGEARGAEALAERGVADLVVVLQEVDEGNRRQVT